MSGNNRRGRGDGGYRKRGDSWELKFEATDPKTGHRKTRWVTFKGTETAARAKLRELVRQADTGGFIATSRQTFGEVLDAWETGLTVSPKTEERWRELIALHIRPALGPLPLRRIGWERVKTFYRDLAEGTKGRALSRSTIKCIHFIVGQVFSLAEREGLISTNPAKLVKLPKSEKQEIQILDKAQVVTVLEKLRGRNPLYRIAALGLATGMRRGEMLALRWKNVDLDRAVIRVEYSLEQTRAKEKGKPPVLRFKPPKTKNGHRSITIPPSMVAELRSLRRSQNEERLKLGLGRTEDGLVFPIASTARQVPTRLLCPIPSRRIGSVP